MATNLQRFVTTSLILMCMLTSFVLWQTGFHRIPVADLRVPQQYIGDLPGCSAIIEGDIEGKKDEFDRLMASKRKKPVSEEFYLNVTKDCRAYIESRGFITMPLSVEERDFPIAYSMVIHEKIEMFERLLRALYSPQNVYCVHVDRKSSEEFHNAVKAIVSCLPNVFIASKLESVIYASWYRVQADLNCMEDLLRSPVQWRYLLNTCGTDFPIKTNGEMVQALKHLNGRNSMESMAAPDYKKYRWQLSFNVTNTVIGTGIWKSPPPIPSPMFSGSAYFVVTRAFVRHILVNKEVQAFLEWGKDTYSPDEHMWATLQRMTSVPGSVPASSKFDETDMHTISRLVKWSHFTGDMRNGAPYSACTGTHQREVCIYGAGDLKWLFEQHHLIANKFDPEVDDVAIRCLESVLHFKAIDQSFRESFLKSV
ncbi:beta-1,3-galactosyl-O-glycosyl-glycoprotein beta-1,6-N-acetylglucosaminyltransferase 3 [Diretmus argenteus]